MPDRSHPGGAVRSGERRGVGGGGEGGRGKTNVIQLLPADTKHAKRQGERNE